MSVVISRKSKMNFSGNPRTLSWCLCYLVIMIARWRQVEDAARSETDSPTVDIHPQKLSGRQVSTWSLIADSSYNRKKRILKPIFPTVGSKSLLKHPPSLIYCHDPHNFFPRIKTSSLACLSPRLPVLFSPEATSLPSDPLEVSSIGLDLLECRSSLLPTTPSNLSPPPVLPTLSRPTSVLLQSSPLSLPFLIAD